MLVVLILLGLCFGSFVNALVWRLHKKRNFVSERSECTHCHHVLAWYDLIPVVSWAMLRGRCRYCHKRIEDSPITELGVAVVFGLTAVLWPFGVSGAGLALLVIWLLSVVLLAALFLYDLRWMLLPDRLIIPLSALGVAWVIVYFGWLQPPAHLTAMLTEIIADLASVTGLYGFLYLVSKGKWIGLGDVKLGVFMGLVLGWKLGLLAVALANMLAFLVVLPGLLTGKLKRTTSIPFGPFLIVATVIALLLGHTLASWYLRIFLAY